LAALNWAGKSLLISASACWRAAASGTVFFLPGSWAFSGSASVNTRPAIMQATRCGLKGLGENMALSTNRIAVINCCKRHTEDDRSLRGPQAHHAILSAGRQQSSISGDAQRVNVCLVAFQGPQF